MPGPLFVSGNRTFSRNVDYLNYLKTVLLMASCMLSALCFDMVNKEYSAFSMVHCANGNHKGLQQISGTGYRSGSGLKKSMENHVSWSETVRALRTCGTTGLSSWASPSLSSKQMVFSDVLHHRLSLPWRTDSAVFCFFVFCFVIRGNGPLCGFTLLRWGVFFVVFSFSSLSLPGLCCLDSVPHFPLVRNHDFPNLTNLVGLTLCEDALFECSPPLGNVQRQRWFIYTKEEMCLSFCRLNLERV